MGVDSRLLKALYGLYGKKNVPRFLKKKYSICIVYIHIQLFFFSLPFILPLLRSDDLIPYSSNLFFKIIFYNFSISDRYIFLVLCTYLNLFSFLSTYSCFPLQKMQSIIQKMKLYELHILFL